MQPALDFPQTRIFDQLLANSRRIPGITHRFVDLHLSDVLDRSQAFLGEEISHVFYHEPGLLLLMPLHEAELHLGQATGYNDLWKRTLSFSNYISYRSPEHLRDQLEWYHGFLKRIPPHSLNLALVIEHTAHFDAQEVRKVKEHNCERIVNCLDEAVRLKGSVVQLVPDSVTLRKWLGNESDWHTPSGVYEDETHKLIYFRDLLMNKPIH